MRIPRLVISGLSGGAGKTMLSLGLARAFARRGLMVRAFKKGPDYIDAAWLALAARAPQANLDPFFTPGTKLRSLFCRGAKGCDLALVEGNRGLFDGLDLEGSCSTAEVARTLDAPVLLILDCTKMTRTVAAVVKGCLTFEENLRITGVILNRTGNERHRALVRKAVEDLCGVPVLGVLPRRPSPFMIERHMGLAGMDEFNHTDALLDSLADFMEAHTDIEGIHSLAAAAPQIPGQAESCPDEASSSLPTALASSQSEPARKSIEKRHSRKPVLGYVYDAAFWFYYRENLDALERAGARLVPVSLLDPAPWPHIDGLYIGGGLPERHAKALSANTRAREYVSEAAARDLPVYAECGGFMYLAKCLKIGADRFDMAGVFDLAIRFHDRPRGLGYVEARVVGSNPYHPLGSEFRGHEFHFSGIEDPGGARRGKAPALPCLLELTRGEGMEGKDGRRYDGLLTRNTYASYMHVYAPAVPDWAPRFISLCLSAAKK